MKDKIKFKDFWNFSVSKEDCLYDLLRKHLLNVTEDWNSPPSNHNFFH